MSARRVQLVLLCEDTQTESFLRQTFRKLGWHPRDIRVQKSPHGRGAGEQWVRVRYPTELRELRRRHADRALVVMVDADRRTVAQRHQAFDEECDRQQVPRRTAEERIIFLVPKRHVETWLAYLEGDSFDEDTVAKPQGTKPRCCKQHARALAAMCRAGELRSPAPPSLEAACDEYRTRL